MTTNLCRDHAKTSPDPEFGSHWSEHLSHVDIDRDRFTFSLSNTNNRTILPTTGSASVTTQALFTREEEISGKQTNHGQ